jgi:hypothetical protein
MDLDDVIDVLQVARAEVEWEYPMSYAIAFDTAIEAVSICAGILSTYSYPPKEGVDADSYLKELGKAIKNLTE